MATEYFINKSSHFVIAWLATFGNGDSGNTETGSPGGAHLDKPEAIMTGAQESDFPVEALI